MFLLSQCSGSVQTLTSTVDLQYFTSVGYSSGTGTYDNNLSCSWLIDSGSTDWKILLYVKNYGITCAGDVINIYDGNDISNTSLATNICGSGQSPVYRSSQRYVKVTFTTDASNQGIGFEIEYFKASDLSGTGCTSAQTLTATTTVQYLSSPSFPSNYDLSANCQWNIKSSSDTLHMDIIFSDIELSTSCSFDGLTIYDVTSSYTSNQTSFLLKFKSDGSLSYTGFILKYYTRETANEVSSSVTITYSDGMTYLFIYLFINSFIKQRCLGML
ncbi:hypothetical protein KUTeg_018030 [Tegillarca granosa]|uniref:CUB domain-containing protein n=1 Tax=Tegillarca granosa TaxID=220873 RepID=A0ABQ9EGM8_TEGGR|nr:hypothetical protein KUTeg_018030 [Tegillarca granosa]